MAVDRGLRARQVRRLYEHLRQVKPDTALLQRFTPRTLDAADRLIKSHDAGDPNELKWPESWLAKSSSLCKALQWIVDWDAKEHPAATCDDPASAEAATTAKATKDGGDTREPRKGAVADGAQDDRDNDGWSDDGRDKIDDDEDGTENTDLGDRGISKRLSGLTMTPPPASSKSTKGKRVAYPQLPLPIPGSFQTIPQEAAQTFIEQPLPGASDPSERTESSMQFPAEYLNFLRDRRKASKARRGNGE
ncbi:hypothetical protein G7046_g7058 [Stylonectria norvegica]|nr:hypothetical protein G7046_g7058 [Stylonectria norvegica]